jgi:peroxiredoxin
MSKQLEAGQTFPPLETRNIHGARISIPGETCVHLQFRRFAGCPICNLHLQSFVRRNYELKRAGIVEIVFFHSSVAELLPYQGSFPFDVVGDAERRFYRQYGVGRSIFSLLHPKTWLAMLRGLITKGRPAISLSPEGGLLGLPADFLIGAGGLVEAVHYGTHADDHWSVDQVLELAARSPKMDRKKIAV